MTLHHSARNTSTTATAMMASALVTVRLPGDTACLPCLVASHLSHDPEPRTGDRPEEEAKNDDLQLVFRFFDRWNVEAHGDPGAYEPAEDDEGSHSPPTSSDDSSPDDREHAEQDQFNDHNGSPHAMPAAWRVH